LKYKPKDIDLNIQNSSNNTMNSLPIQNSPAIKKVYTIKYFTFKITVEN